MGPKLNIDDELNNEVQTLAEQELQEKMSINSEPAKSAQVEFVRLDPIKLYDQINQIRSEGVEESVIREAFNQFMEQATNRTPKAKTVMKRHVDSIPMPSNEEIMKFYEERYKVMNDASTNPQVAAILGAMEIAQENRKIRETIPLKTKIARYIAIKLLAFTIFMCKLLGVK